MRVGTRSGERDACSGGRRVGGCAERGWLPFCASRSSGRDGGASRVGSGRGGLSARLPTTPSPRPPRQPSQRVSQRPPLQPAASRRCSKDGDAGEVMAAAAAAEAASASANRLTHHCWQQWEPPPPYRIAPKRGSSASDPRSLTGCFRKDLAAEIRLSGPVLVPPLPIMVQTEIYAVVGFK